ncbi:D-alanyl-D-alanine carboxypeptidase [Calothrix sp. UHCC 0171]|uniref:D-alanyl-D-alanine carboxypeptidase n=1 Tax=Calothrix sp. UHCC 0171 TaxID=3110245 RepID=UPI002B1ECE2E|nr:D-alanyl-D-alanine carboxypeptidase [Calothrix sp. UHCC 0171]MEA5573038.1 D-alanyl-D-alanine carboxypeptidase [Calothrix sp. UHCC 0171]
MHKSLSFTTALSCVLLALAGGCSLSDSSAKKSPSQQNVVNAVAPIPKPELPLIFPPDNSNPATNAKALQYVKSLAPYGSAQQSHGIWMQSGEQLLANHQGTTPITAASISKVATTLAALKTFGAEHVFVTQVGTPGIIEDGILKGDLVIQGGEDPFFVWEEAIALGNTLKKMGIKEITGDLIIADKFYMNFSRNPSTVGNLLKMALNSQTWNRQVVNAHKSLPPETPKPQIVINGKVKALATAPANIQLLVRHNSYPLAELLKKMNNFSNNAMADMLADSVGGAPMVAQIAATTAEVPQNEIYLINGSGLTYENKISPRAAIAMFRAIEKHLKQQNMTVADVFTVIGEDEGILKPRGIPKFAVVKSGSLDTTSALVGAIPTQKQGTVWFAIMNFSGDLVQFRKQQDIFLTSLVKDWGAVSVAPAELAANPGRKDKISNTEIVVTQQSAVSR